MRRLTVAVEQAQATLNTAAGDVLKLQMVSDPLLRQQLEAAAELDRANLEKSNRDWTHREMARPHQ